VPAPHSPASAPTAPTLHPETTGEPSTSEPSDPNAAPGIPATPTHGDTSGKKKNRGGDDCDDEQGDDDDD
jgi:hypothetical protein